MTAAPTRPELANDAQSGSHCGCSDLLPSPIYQDHLVKIYHGDCRELMPKMPRGLVVSDPPYNVGYHYEGYDDNLSEEEYFQLLDAVCPMPCVMINYPENVFKFAWQVGRFPEEMVAWVYNANTPKQWRLVAWFGEKPDLTKCGQPYKNPTDKRVAERIAQGREARLYDWWQINQVKNVGAEKTEHPCQIPTEIMRRILKITDCKLVVDPFCGSGTTLVAAKQLGIPAVGIEQNETYCKIAADRCASELALGLAG